MRTINVGGNQGRGNPPAYDTEGTLDEPLRRWNLIATGSWLGIVLAVVAGLLWAVWSTP
jgi:hypothetical protein